MGLVQAAALSADRSDAVFLYVFALSAAVLVAITVVMVWFVIRYRRSRNPVASQIEGHAALEATWTLLPLVIFLAIFYYGWTAYDYMSRAPRDAMVVRVTARQWTWSFAYPNGKQTAVLYAPINRPMKVEVRSVDVIHGFFVPAFRIKVDALPTQTNTTWFQATSLGTFDILCTVLCGVNHSQMLSAVVVVTEEEFRAWYFGGEDAPEPGAPPRAAGAVADPPGLRLLREKDCLDCHSLDGEAMVCPTFKGILGREQVVVTAGEARTVVVDEAWLRAGITEPERDIVRGYPPEMPRVPLTAEELDAMVSFLKTVR